MQLEKTTSANIIAELSAAETQLSQAQIQHFTAKVNRFDRVFVYGAGRTGLVLKAFAMRLMQLGKTPFVIGETITPSIRQGDLLVVASASGSTKSVCDYVGAAVEKGVDIAAIVGCEGSPLESLVVPDLMIRAGNKHEEVGLQPMGSLFEQLLLITLDAVILDLSSSAERRRAMQARHANLE